MPTILRYIGASERYSELPLTGSQQVWLRGQQGPVDDVFASRMLASGLFARVDAPGSILDATGLSRPTIAGFGDSFLNQGWNSWRAPWFRSESTTLTGIQFVSMQRKAAAGAHSLVYTAATRSVSWDGGPATPVLDGYQIIPGPGDNNGCAILGRTAILSESNGSLTCTRSGTRPDEFVGSNSSLFWFGVFSNQGYLIRGHGHSGGWALDAPSIIERADEFDAFVMNYHTNDIQGGSTLAQLQARTIANLDLAYAKSRAKKGIVNGCCPFRSGWTAAQSEIADAFNRWLPGALKAYPGVVAQFPWSILIDDTGAAGNSAMMNADNIHPDDPAAFLTGKGWADHFAKVLPGTPWDFGGAVGGYSADNPNGNMLLNPNPAGDTSGRPTGWDALTVDPLGSATPTKVARTDGIAGSWARITGSATTGNATHYFRIPPAMFRATPQIGQMLQLFVEVKLSGAPQMVPTVMLSDAQGGPLVAYSRVNNSASKNLPVVEWQGVIATPVYMWSDTPGAATIDLRVGMRMINGVSGAILDIGRIWVGTPDEFSIS